MPRRGGVFDAPQPILHPIASHATFDDSTAVAAPQASASASASAPQPSQPSSSEQQQPQQQQQPAWKITRPDQPPPEQLSFSYLRSKKLEPYLPPPVDEHHPPASLTLTHNFAPPAQHQYQQHQQQQPQQPQNQQHHTAGPAHQQQQHQQPASSPESPAPSAHEEEGEHHHHHHQQQGARHGDAAAEGEEGGDEDDDEDEEEDEEDLDWKPRPFVTLTYAQSLDSAIATAPGARTALSGPPTKAMTHFLRSRHDAILVGVGTAAADDPGLNCRLEVEMGGGHQPRPVVLDPRGRWAVTRGSRVVQLAREGKGLGPWVLVAEGVVPDPERAAVLEEVGGRYVAVEVFGGRYVVTESARGTVGGGQEAEEEDPKGKKAEVKKEEEAEEKGDDDDGPRPPLTWDNIFGVLWEEGINSVMVEGGATVINNLLLLANEGLDVVDSVIVTVAPVWLGAGAVTVAPERPVDTHMRRVPGPRLTDVVWIQMGHDMVLGGRIMR